MKKIQKVIFEPDVQTSVKMDKYDLVRRLMNMDMRFTKLQADFEAIGIETERINEVTGDIDDLVFDLFGMPHDNTVEQNEKHGEKGFNRPDTFCRDLFEEVYDSAICQGTDESIEMFIEFCRGGMDIKKWFGDESEEKLKRN